MSGLCQGAGVGKIDLAVNVSGTVLQTFEETMRCCRVTAPECDMLNNSDSLANTPAKSFFKSA